MKRIFLFAVLLIAVRSTAQTLIAEKAAPTTFSLDRATIYVDPSDHALVQLSARLLQSDIEAVTGKKLPISHAPANAGNMIVIGSLDRSSYIQKVVKNKRIDEAELKGKWEGYLLQVLSQPQAGNALIIAGSDRRGTAYGVFEFSKQIGVSPWYWWADVPVSKKQSIHINKGVKITDAPKVKYRGIFINDEAPALSNWSKEKFGGFNHHFYEKVFELMLRLKSNYIWPAMWGNAFYYDDSLNIKTADEFGIVIGTSHHEPLMRAHEEWKYYGKGKKWNYDSTETGLKEFWKGGMQRAWNEKIVSVGMRGDGDEPMSRETATALLERIVKDQRQIIADVTGKPAEQTPQLWALYKEVQDYYDKGMRVPDDVTLLLCDDNWGNIRKLPKLDEKPRKGGYGIYYHFDYVGGPRNYKWVNTNPIPRVWEQMHMAWEYKARQIWIVNAGDIKPMEFPISFFLDYAWNPEKIGPDDLQQYTEQWTAAQFGKEHAKDIADILSKYAKYNSRRKPELLDDKTYNFSGGEWYSVTEEWKALLEKAEYIGQQLEPAWKDAYFQLVLHPVKACANLNEMYHDLAVNKYYASQNLAETNLYADSVKILYEKDSLITQQYHQLNKGKWNYMMSQAHIGYTYWQQPPQQKMPAITYLSKDSILDSLGTERFRTRKEMFWPWANPSGRNIFYTLDYMVSMDASHYSQAVNSNGIKWTILPDHGRTGSAVTSFPVAAKAQQPGKNAPHLQYDVYINKRDTFNLLAYFSPTLNIHNTPEGLQYAISVDDEVPQIISINKDDTITGRGIWGKWVSENIIIKTTRHKVLQPGTHTVKYWMVNSGVVLQKIVLELGVRPSYLGPPETLWHAGLEVRDED